MSTIPPRQQAILARRIACGLPLWAAARGSNLPAEAVGELMWEEEFRELIGAFAEILEMDPEARRKRLLKLAHAVIEARLACDDPRTALFVEREYRRGRDPVASVATGFSRTVERERVKAAAAKPPAPAPALASAAAAEAARRLRATLDPEDAAMWRQAGALRRDLLGEQVLHHAVARRADRDRRLGPPSILHPAEDSADPAPLPPQPQAAEQTDKKEETEAEFAARATALFDRTLRQAPPGLRGLLATFSQEQLWALVEKAGGEPFEEGAAEPLGP